MSDQKKIGVYILAPEGCEKVYAGSSKDVDHRVKQHQRNLANGRHYNKSLQKAYDESNGNVDVIIVPVSTREDAFDFEQKILDRGIPEGTLFNRSRDARYCSVEFSQEHCENISKAKMGCRQKPEHTEKLRQLFTGVPLSEEHKEKIRQANLGRVSSPEELERLRTMNIGRKHTPEAISRMSEARKGRTFSDEQRQKMSDSRKGMVFSDEHRANMSKARVGKAMNLSEESRENRSAISKERANRPEVKEDLRTRMMGNTHALGTKKSAESVEKTASANRVPISVDGVVYESTKAAAEAFGISSGNVNFRLKSMSENFSGWTYVDKK